MKLPKLTEFETKYRVSGDSVYQFKKILESMEAKYSFLYTQVPDRYYTKEDGSFIRFRKSQTHKYAEITMKEKTTGSKNNIRRKEVNWRVDYGIKHEEISAGAEMLGYTFNCKIDKMCHIYKFKDATLAFYTVVDDKDKIDHFIEIELEESTIHTLTQQEAMEKIREYENILSPLGITHNKRLTKSLYEMYVRDIYERNESEDRN